MPIVAASRLETRLVEHGIHELKGIAAPLVVWSVLWERLADQRARGVLLPPWLDRSGRRLRWS